MKLSQKKKESIIFFNSLLCSLLILTYFFSYHNLAITKFDDRIIGNMVLNNINSIGFINFFILSLFLIFPLLLFICYKILTNLYKNSTTDIFEFNKKISIFGLLSYFFGFFGFLNNYSRYSTFFLAIIFCIITILNLILYRYNTKLESKYIQIFEYTTLISIPLTTLCSLFIHNLRLFNFNNHLIFIIIYMLSICQ